MPREAEPGADGRDGFTLIEALAALTVVALGLGALANLTHQTALSATFAERHVELIETARKALAALPERATLAEGVTEGELNGERWRLTVRPYPGAAAAGWRPERVALEVRDGAGHHVEIETLRLVRGSGP